MAYTHDGKKPVNSKNDPIDPDGTDWQFFHYDDWLRTGKPLLRIPRLLWVEPS